MEPFELVKIAAKALDDKKAKDIDAIKVGDLTILADYFLVASGTSSTQVKALADEVEHKLEEAGLRPHHIEGRATSWILLDYTSVIIHIFYAPTREFYALERLWNDGEKVDLAELLKKPE